MTGIGVGLYDAITAGNLTDVIPNDGTDPIIVMAMPADLATDLLSSPAHGLTTDNQVRFEAFPGASGLPTGLSENTTYWVIATGLTADQFKVSTTQGGGAVNITAAGRALLMKLTPVVINQNDQPQFQSGVLKLVADTSVELVTKPAGVEVWVGPRPEVGQSITVEVTYVAKTDLPLVGVLMPDPTLRARTVMRVER